MPTQDSRVTSNFTLRCQNALTFFDTLRESIDERLNASRNLFNISKNRVGNSKRCQYAKRVRTKDLNIDTEWITSGNVGSRDSVLLFQTKILNSQQTRQNSDTKTNTNTAHPDDNQHKFTSPLKAKTNIESRDGLCLKTRRSNSLLDVKNFKLQKVPSPITLNDLKYSSRLLNHQKDKHYSLSSSDNSFSSEYDNAEEGESTEKPTTTKAAEDASKLEDYEPENEEDDEEIPDTAHSENMPALMLNIKYKFMQTETKLLRKIFTRHGLTEVSGDETYSILWTGIHMKPDILRNLAPYQRVNHFPRSYELTRKDRLYKNIERMQHLRGAKHFDIIPQSFILPLEYRDLISAHNKCRGPWIVKPAASSRGRGIFIVNTPDQIPQDEQVLVSKYVSNPLCINGNKCDLRVYVLVTSFDPLIIYIYEEGLVRLATVKYECSAENLWNPCMHLCNYSINKYHSDYQKSNDAHDEDSGHKWTLSALLRHLRSQGYDTFQLMSNIEDLIIKSILSSAQSIISACRMFVPNGNNCFELYGFDILIDESFKPWLLEINLSPSLGVDSPLDTKVKASMICDLLTLIGVPAYTQEMRDNYDTQWSRFKNLSCTRRTVSADAAVNTTVSRRSTAGPGAGAHQGTVLTAEEQRIVRNARFQEMRRGGFVRIFPTQDSMQRYGAFLDSATGIPMCTSLVQGQNTFSTILPHNYNLMLHTQLCAKDGNKKKQALDERMAQYERVLVSASRINFAKKRLDVKCSEESKVLRKKLLRLINQGSELTPLQARKLFSLYLEAVLRRLSQDPREYHEKLILKFINRVGGAVKPPVYYKNYENSHVISKARSAMVAKLLGDFLDQYNRETETYVDCFDHCGMIPTSLFREFISHAQESDLESILTFHTNITGCMPYLYNRCGLSVPPTPPIPSGLYGFLKALPAMVVTGAGKRDFNQCESFYKSSNIACNEVKKQKKRSSKR